MKSKKVLMKISNAKWHLDNPEIYECSGQLQEPYESDTLLHLVCCLGEPVYGTVLSESRSTANCWLVKFRVGNLTAQYYVEREHIEFI